jgi:hypothetical protein
MALLTEGELALSWINSERQNNNTNASPLLVTRDALPSIAASLTPSLRSDSLQVLNLLFSKSS